MDQAIEIELIKSIPTILWILFAVVLVYIFYEPIKNQLIPNLTGIKAFGFEATFIRQELEKATKQEQSITQEDLDQVMRRAELLSSILKGTNLLLLNDSPIEMIYIIKILQSLGIFVDIAHNTDEAIAFMREIKYDVLVSDMKRDGIPDEGIRFLNKARELKLARPTIFSVGSYDPEMGVPPYAFGITNRTDQLLNLVFDAVERERIGKHPHPFPQTI